MYISSCITLLKNYNLAKIVDCSDLTECSASCGGGTQTCTRSCENGSFGEDGCPNEEKIKTNSCNPQKCRKY